MFEEYTAEKLELAFWDALYSELDTLRNLLHEATDGSHGDPAKQFCLTMSARYFVDSICKGLYIMIHPEELEEE